MPCGWSLDQPAFGGRGTHWARFSTDVCGGKAHVVYDPDLGCPIYHMITEAKSNDITAAEGDADRAAATYVFDLGYYDYGCGRR